MDSNIITKLADNFVKYNIDRNVKDKSSKIIETAREQIADIDDRLDKIKFTNRILEGNNIAYTLHLKECTNLESCPENIARESINYFLSQELNRLGVKINEDAFTMEEKQRFDEKLDNILKQLETLKNGQEILFDELKEMKDLFFLGKKKWHQLIFSKTAEMTAAGMISETVSKDILESLSNLKNLIVQFPNQPLI